MLKAHEKEAAKLAMSIWENGYPPYNALTYLAKSRNNIIVHPPLEEISSKYPQIVHRYIEDFSIEVLLDLKVIQVDDVFLDNTHKASMGRELAKQAGLFSKHSIPLGFKVKPNWKLLDKFQGDISPLLNTSPTTILQTDNIIAVYENLKLTKSGFLFEEKKVCRFTHNGKNSGQYNFMLSLMSRQGNQADKSRAIPKLEIISDIGKNVNLESIKDKVNGKMKNSSYCVEKSSDFYRITKK